MNTAFWSDPPWQGGKGKHRVGLKPIPLPDWFTPLDTANLAVKQQLLEHSYSKVVAVDPQARLVDSLLRNLPVAHGWQDRYADAIANLALSVADDVCVLDVSDQQRLVAACVCAPSYWSIQEKIGLPLIEIHAPVDGLNAKLGTRIEQFVQQAPVGQPFERRNWFLHGDDVLFHPEPEGELSSPVSGWMVRSERQTLCRLDTHFLLFTIQIVCEPLLDIWSFPQARADLVGALDAMDADEIAHFGGQAKYQVLNEYLERPDH